ncbi:bacillithiol biosynthesis deacetylase BshB2 [Paenibacillus sp. IB182496]|uniref:Bacillithiol biosynthesis deacetylase BshB2 n=1 Tax=Paenibacillus sabuli TaxID=2772509 RepID=A0A927BW95_9BACL|nr:bacillithiol biosynthesis deacetylase BshB2 [Paenibacillus sabuli]MBD2846664.1 bacillithiol biosynthesis deacetylase BshB2 [Paenibacillus sabuli]
MTDKRERHVLVVLPHPDDEAFGVAGTVAGHARRGTPVTYACLTLGQMGRNMGIPPFASRVTLPDIRRRELEASCRALGIADLRMPGFHDKMLEFEDPALLDGAIGGLLRELQPSLVLTFYPGHAVHPDHDACGAAVVRAVAALPERERPVVHAVAIARDHERDIGPPDVIVDVRDTLGPKLAAIRAHRSQFQAAELMGTGSYTEEELQARFGTERYWTYRFGP